MIAQLSIDKQLRDKEAELVHKFDRLRDDRARSAQPILTRVTTTSTRPNSA
jgi:hypothetical protein